MYIYEVYINTKYYFAVLIITGTSLSFHIRKNKKQNATNKYYQVPGK